MREATYVLDGLLYQDAPEIKEHYTDTHGYTDLILGCSHCLASASLLGSVICRDETPLPRTRKGADYGVLAPTLKKDIRTSSSWNTGTT